MIQSHSNCVNTLFSSLVRYECGATPTGVYLHTHHAEDSKRVETESNTDCSKTCLSEYIPTPACCSSRISVFAGESTSCI